MTGTGVFYMTGTGADCFAISALTLLNDVHRRQSALPMCL